MINFIIAFCGVTAFSPLLVFVILCLYFADKGTGIFFLHDRPRKNRVIFKVIKFKTMHKEPDDSGALLTDPQRLTKVSKSVCTTSIDELPQLNILKNDISLVGPWPLLSEY